MRFIYFTFIMGLSLLSQASSLPPKPGSDLAMIKNEFPATEDHCKKYEALVFSLVNEAKAEKIESTWWIDLNLRCAMRIVFWETTESAEGALAAFRKKKEGFQFEGTDILFFRVVRVFSEIKFEFGIFEKSGVWKNPPRVVSHPMTFPHHAAQLDHVWTVLGKGMLKTVQQDPTPFLAYLEKYVTPEFSKEVKEKLLKESNRIEVDSRPHYVLENLEVIPMVQSVGYGANCSPDWPNCKLGK